MAYKAVKQDDIHRFIEALDETPEAKPPSRVWKFSKWLSTQILVSGTFSLFFFLIFRHFLIPPSDSSTSTASLEPIQTTLMPFDTPEDVVGPIETLLKSSDTPASYQISKGDVDLRALDALVLDEPRLKFREFVSGTAWKTFESDIMIPISRDPFEEEYDEENCFRWMTEDMTCADNDTIFYLNEQLTCGGLPIGDICLMPMKSKFLDRKNVRPQEGKLCQSINETMVGHNDKGFWVPSQCSITDTAPKSLIEKLGGKRIALIGDSHTRNLFEGFLCEIRDAALCPDAKTGNNIYYYHFNETHDDLSLIEKKEMIYEIDFDSSDVHIMFFWMPIWDSLDLGVIGHFNPDVVLVSVAGWERTKHDDPEWRASWDSYLLTHDVRKFIFFEFPYGGGQKKKEFILPWMENRDFMEFYSVKQIYNMYDGEQTKHSWHTLCKVRDRNDKDSEIHAYILCTGTAERNQARIMLTSFVATLQKD